MARLNCSRPRTRSKTARLDKHLPAPIPAVPPPETAPEEAEDPANGYGNGRWFTFRHVEDMREIMVANGDEAKQVAYW